MKDQVCTKAETGGLSLTYNGEKAPRSKDKRDVKCHASPFIQNVGLGQLFLRCNMAVLAFSILRSLQARKEMETLCKRHGAATKLLQTSLGFHS